MAHLVRCSRCRLLRLKAATGDDCANQLSRGASGDFDDLRCRSGHVAVVDDDGDRPRLQAEGEEGAGVERC
jgi:hypothetical protein